MYCFDRRSLFCCNEIDAALGGGDFYKAGWRDDDGFCYSDREGGCKNAADNIVRTKVGWSVVNWCTHYIGVCTGVTPSIVQQLVLLATKVNTYHSLNAL